MKKLTITLTVIAVLSTLWLIGLDENPASVMGEDPNVPQGSFLLNPYPDSHGFYPWSIHECGLYKIKVKPDGTIIKYKMTETETTKIIEKQRRIEKMLRWLILRVCETWGYTAPRA